MTGFCILLTSSMEHPFAGPNDAAQPRQHQGAEPMVIPPPDLVAQPVVLPVAADYTFEQYHASLQNADAIDYSLGVSRLEGADVLSRHQLVLMRTVFTYVLSLSRAYMVYLRFLSDPRLGVALEHAQALFQDPELPAGADDVHVAPALAPSLTINQLLENIDNLSYWQCQHAWGPSDQLVRNCLSPACLAFYSWLGPERSKHVLMLMYLLCNDKLTWVTACMASPVRTTHLQLSKIGKRLQDWLRSSGFDTAAAAVVGLCSRAQPTLERASQALFCITTTFEEIPRQQTLDGVITRPSVASIVANSAAKFVAPAPHAPDTTMAVLPTSSSLPIYTPNFDRDDRINWIRTAEHKFKNIQFPSKAITQGDIDSELSFHRYCCQILHSRVLCMELSEAQVIEHLSIDLKQHDAQFTVAKSRAQQPNCTVRSWLDAIRSAFFTSGEFRMTIETAWRQYKISQARDFNDLLHHIRTYYQLIFLDYANLAGDMKLHDYAWHLFDKMTHLTTTCHSPLARVVQTYFSKTELLSQMVAKLKQPKTGGIDKEKPALEFLEWTLTQLQVAKESANIAQRYSATHTSNSDPVDFAALQELGTRTAEYCTHSGAVALASSNQNLSAPRMPSNQTHMQDYSPRRHGGASSTAHYGQSARFNRPYGWQLPRGQQNKQHRVPPRHPTTPVSGSARPHCPIMPELRHIVGSKDQHEREAFAERAALDNRHPRRLLRRLQLELGNPGAAHTLHGLLRRCGVVHAPTNPHDMVIYLLRSYYIFARPLCCACDGRNYSHAERDHDVAECPTVAGHVAAVHEWRAYSENAGWGFRAWRDAAVEAPHLADQQPAAQLRGPPRLPPPPPVAAPIAGSGRPSVRERYASRSPSRGTRSPRPPNKRARNIR